MNKPQRFTKKPVTIEASQWFKHGDHPEVTVIPADHPIDRNCIDPISFGWVPTLESGHVVSPGDWIIKGVKGEFYPCKPDIFEMTYDAEAQQPAGDVVTDAEPVSDKELRSLANRYGVDDSSLGSLRNFADAYNVAAVKHVGDSARIDWLEQHNEDTYNYDVICCVFGSGFYVGDDPTNKHASLRSAIDAALASSARKGE